MNPSTDCTQYTIELTPDEQAEVLRAYDNGIQYADPKILDRVMAKLKNQIHP